MTAWHEVDVVALCADVFAISDPLAKARAAARIARLAVRRPFVVGATATPGRPGRPERPALLSPKAMPKRNPGSARGRTALLHALAHIELNAIDLALDIIIRFAGEDGPLPRELRPAFCRDWLAVARDEAKHFRMIARRLRQLDAQYGDFPAHDGLWTAAEKTGQDLLARLAVVPLVHEARGLDVQPAMIARFSAIGDDASAKVLQIIADDEIGHVRTGYTWFLRLCALQSVEPRSHYRALVERYHGSLSVRDVNVDARRRAGLPEDFYLPH